MLVAIKVVLQRTHFTPPNGRHSKGSAKEPDERDEDGVRPRSGYCAFFPCKVPLAVLHEKVPGQEKHGERQEEEEAVVKVSVANAVFVAKIPRQVDDLRVEGERDAEGGY